MAATPRLRQDLTVTPAQDAGVLYFDVRDPRTGNVLRLYDIEWWVAERFDGTSSYEELSRWAQDALGFAPSRADLEVYAQRLQALGLFDFVDAPRSAGLRATDDPRETRATVRTYDGPVTSGVPGLLSGRPAGPLVIGPPPSEPSSLTPVVQGAISQLSAVLSEPEPVLSGGVPMAVDNRGAQGALAIDALGPQGTLSIESRDRERPSLRLHIVVPTAASDDVMGAPLQPASEGPSAPPRVLPPVGPPPGQPAVREPVADSPSDRRSTLMMPTTVGEEVARVELPPTTTQPIAPLEAPPPTVPAVPQQGEAVPVVLNDPERSTPLLSPMPDLRVEAPEPPPAASSETPAYASGDVSPRNAETVEIKKPAEPQRSDLPTSKLAAAPTTVSEQVKAEAEQPKVNNEPDADEAPQGGVGRWIALAVVLMALAVAVYFVMQLHSTPRTPVSVLRAQPHAVPRTGEGTAIVRGGGGQVLRMEAGGLLASVVAEGADVTPGMSLAVLGNHAKVQKDIVDLRDRLTFYQRKLDQARERGENGGEAQAKVNEKRERLAQAEAALKKSELLAPRAGKVKRVLAKAGEMVSPGSDIVELADSGLGAELKLAGESMNAGDEVRLRGPAGVVAGRVSAVADGKAQIALPADAALKAGDELRVVKGEESGVTELPETAIVGGNGVFVVSGGKAARRAVDVLDREGGQIRVKGLQAGDEVIVGGSSDLREGQLVQVQ